MNNLAHGKGLLRLLRFECLPSLRKHRFCLHTHRAITPLLLDLIVEGSCAARLDAGELAAVLRIHLGEGNNGASLHVRERSEASTALDNAERDLHLAAERREPDNKLDGVDIVRDDHQFSLLLLDKSSHMLKTRLKNDWSLRGSLAIGSGFKALSLLGLRLGLVLGEELEKLSCTILVQSLVELVDGRGRFDTLQEDLLLSLQAHIARPSHISGQIAALGANVSTYAEIFGGSLKERSNRRRSLGGLLRSLGRHSNNTTRKVGDVRSARAMT